MALKQCAKCSEMVEEAKAFCPGCGNSFVLETKREVVSNFESFEGTINLGDAAFNQMLSEMGLNISKTPEAPAKRIEILTAEPAAAAPPVKIVDSPTPKSNKKWFILAGVLAVLILFLVIALVVLLLVLSRFPNF